MSPHFPVLNGRQVAKALRVHGFRLISQTGSHQKWRSRNGRQVIVPQHGSKPIPIGTLKSIIEGSGLSVDAFC